MAKKLKKKYTSGTEYKSRNRLTHKQLPTYAADENAKLYSQYGNQFDHFLKR